MANTVYLDAATSQPLHPAARDVLLAAQDDGWADPQALHAPGRRARLLLDNVREVIAHLLGARPDEMVFTASGTAAVHTGLAGVAWARERAGKRIVHSAVEHSAVLHAAAWLERHGTRSQAVGVDATGRVDAAEFAAAATAEGTAVACLQQANQEVATVQPTDEVGAACQEAGVPLLVDAAAAVGHLEVPSNWSVLTASARKWGGPAGIGVLAVRKGTRWREPWPADERGYVNVPGALAAAAALQAVVAERAEVAQRQSELVDRIRTRVRETVPDVDVAGDRDRRLPHLVTFSCLHVDGEALVTELARRGFGVASGSACASGTLEPSHVLAAMGALTHGNVRVSLTRDTSEEEIERFLAELPDVVARERARVGV